MTIPNKIYDMLADNGWKCASRPDERQSAFTKERFYIIVTSMYKGIRLVMYEGDSSTKTAYLLATANDGVVPNSVKSYNEIPFGKFVSLIGEDISKIPIAAGNYVTENLLETI